MRELGLTQAELDDWLQALESGEYNQGHGALIDTAGPGGRSYCCMGVLCDRFVQRGMGRWSGLAFFEGEKDEPHAGYPPVHWVADDIGGELARLNDEQGKTFPEIAQWIRENVRAVGRPNAVDRHFGDTDSHHEQDSPGALDGTGGPTGSDT